jgi:hypothetical protein
MSRLVGRGLERRYYPDPPFTLDVEWLHLFSEWVAEEGLEDATARAASVFDDAFAPRLRAWWEANPRGKVRKHGFWWEDQ